jgi:hypothetical protein
VENKKDRGGINVEQAGATAVGLKTTESQAQVQEENMAI